jgi:RHS repeat-associated protein
VTQYAYDDVGNVQTRTDANTHVMSYAYNDANRLERVTASDNRVWTYAYDPNGNVKDVIDANGNSTAGDQGDGKTTYGYDAVDRLTSVTYADSTPDVTFQYDGNDNRTQMTDGSGTETSVFDPLDRLTSITRGTSVLSFGYDLLNLISRAYPGMPVTTYGYDDDEHLASVSWGANTLTYEHDPAGNLGMTDFPDDNGWTENRYYDDAGRLTGITTGPEGAFLPGDLSTFSMSLDPVGNPLEIVRTGTLEQTQTYSYDNMDRLKGVCFQAGDCPGGSDPFIRWSYDGVGNRLSESRPAGTTAYSYNAADELQQAGGTSYTYDKNGNQLSAGARAFAYDLANRMKTTSASGTTTTYAYDGEGKRLQASTGAGASQKTNFLWDPSFALPQLALESDGVGAALRRYRYGLRRISMSSGSTVSYFHPDGLGSTADLTAGVGGASRWTWSYEPFGAIRSEQQWGTGQPANPMRFTGEYLDPTGLYHLRARQYDPGTGRFLSRDPVAAPLNLPFVSAYAYVTNRPTIFADPSGLVLCEGTRQVFASLFRSSPPGSICALEEAGKAVQAPFRRARDALPPTIGVCLNAGGGFGPGGFVEGCVVSTPGGSGLTYTAGTGMHHPSGGLGVSLLGSNAASVCDLRGPSIYAGGSVGPAVLAVGSDVSFSENAAGELITTSSLGLNTGLPTPVGFVEVHGGGSWTGVLGCSAK